MSPDQDQGGAKFYFGRTVIDIKARDSAVPRVDADTVAPYAELALADEFYLGRKNLRGQLVYLETWTRTPQETLALDTLVAGKPLADYRIEMTGEDTATQTPRFFLRSGADGWREVPVEATEGETSFIRLRLLPAFEGRPVEPYAEILTQQIERKTHYSYSATGDLAGITVQQRSTGFRSETILQSE